MKMLRMALLGACACIAMLAPTAYAHEDTIQATMTSAAAPSAVVNLPVASDANLDAVCIANDQATVLVARTESLKSETFALKVSMTAEKHTELMTLAMNDAPGTGNCLMNYRQ